ncbi:MAG: hypothetical protein J6K74_07545 [Marinifilaceae bacterium]|nr:hypothetical protein [Marinifilaceae bacterium]
MNTRLRELLTQLVAGLKFFFLRVLMILLTILNVLCDIITNKAVELLYIMFWLYVWFAGWLRDVIY